MHVAPIGHQRFPPGRDPGKNSWTRTTFRVRFVKRIERLAQPSSQVSKRKSVEISFGHLEKFFEINCPSKALHCSLSLSSLIIYLASRHNKINQTRTQTCRSENLEKYTSTSKMSIIPRGRHDYNYGHSGVTRRNRGTLRARQASSLQ